MRAAAAWRTSAIAIGFGAVAGIIAALTLRVMHGLQALVWGVSDASWSLVVAILVGGVLIAVVAEVSSSATLRMARSCEEQQLIGQVGSAAALSGLYGSPPGGTVYESDDITPSKPLIFVAAVVGPLGFLLTSALLGGLDVPALDLPQYVTAHNGTDLLRAVVPALAAAAGAAAYMVVGPVAALLIGLFVVQGVALGPLLVGVAVGALVLRLLDRHGAPKRTAHATT